MNDQLKYEVALHLFKCLVSEGVNLEMYQGDDLNKQIQKAFIRFFSENKTPSPEAKQLLKAYNEALNKTI